MHTRFWFWSLAAVVLLVVSIVWWREHALTLPTPYTFDLVSGDTVSSWSFQGAYTGHAELVQKAETEITRLSNLIGTTDSDYEIYVSIANQYDLLGDGENELRYLKYALAIDAETTGLAWYNLGVLFDRLHAYHTARTAYQNAAKAQAIAQYLNAYQEYARAHPAPR